MSKTVMCDENYAARCAILELQKRWLDLSPLSLHVKLPQSDPVSPGQTAKRGTSLLRQCWRLRLVSGRGRLQQLRGLEIME